jgi:transcription initiation factor TFIIB
MVVTDKVQESRAEWNNFTNDQENNRSRTGMPISLARHDRGLATIIGKSNRDASGQEINAAMRSTFERLRTWDYRTQQYSPTDRNLKDAFTKLEILKDKLRLPESVIEKAAYIYRKVQERGLVRGRTIAATLSVAVYIACRDMGLGTTLKDIANIANIKEKEFARIYRIVITELDLKMPMVDPLKGIVKIANKCEVSEKTKRYGIKIINNITNNSVSAGKNPMGLAGAALYLACKYHKEDVTQMRIAEAAGVTEVTIRNTLKDIQKRNLIFV